MSGPARDSRLPVAPPSRSSRSLRTLLSIAALAWLALVAAGVLALSYGLVTLAVAVAVAATAVTVWVARRIWRTVAPLEDLSWRAVAGEEFPTPGRSCGVAELDALGAALHQLDTAVREREQRLEEAHGDALAFGRFAERIQQSADEEALLDTLSARLAAVTGAEDVRLLVRSPASPGRLDIVRGAHRPDRLALPLLDEPLRCRAYKTLRPVTARAGSPEACDCALVPRDGAYGCEVMLAAGEPIGVASLALRGAELLDNNARRRVHASLGFGAASLASQRQFAETREAALRDALTGAHNRTFLGEFLNKHLVLAERRAVGIGVIVLDLDHFKRLNDTWGHDVGDRALVETVATLNRELRQSDAVVRLGGEEFCAVLIDTSLERSVEIAERLRAAIAAIRILADDGEVAFTASLGVAAFPEHGSDQQSLLAAADRATYVAKDAGRNQVRAADAADPPRRSRPRLAVPSP